jgi:hypothetical protein
MEQALIVILGFMGPLILVGVIGIFLMLNINKKEKLHSKS